MFDGVCVVGRVSTTSPSRNRLMSCVSESLLRAVAVIGDGNASLLTGPEPISGPLFRGRGEKGRCGG